MQEAVHFAARYNIAPGERIPVIDNRPKAERVLVPMRWGLVPYWAKDPAIGNKLVNARCETVAAKPSFRSAFARRRCLIAADGFYEWRRDGKSRTPFYVRRRDRGFLALAGLWERWHAPDDTWLVSCTVITTAANRLMQPIHDRMPVIVAPEDYDRWLDPGELTRGALEDVLCSAADDVLETYQVSPLVNSVKNDSPACIEPIPAQTRLF